MTKGERANREKKQRFRFAKLFHVVYVSYEKILFSASEKSL